MPRISREAVTRREALARTLFKEGKTPEEVQAAMMEVDVGGGRKGLKMESGRLAELARAHAPKKEPDKNTDTGTDVDPNVTHRIQEAEVDLAATRARIEEGKKDARTSGLGYYTGMPEEVAADLKEGSLLFPPTKEKLEREESAVASDTVPGGIIRAHQCRIGTKYADVDLPSLVGTFTSTHGGLYCFEMEDGRVFKLYNNDKVRVHETV